MLYNPRYPVQCSSSKQKAYKYDLYSVHLPTITICIFR